MKGQNLLNFVSDKGVQEGRREEKRRIQAFLAEADVPFEHLPVQKTR